MGSRKSELSQRGTANSFWEWFRQLSVFGFLIFSIFDMFLGVPESVFISEQWIWGSETCFFSFFQAFFFNVQSKNGLPKHAAFQIHKTRPTLCPLASWLKASRASAAPRAAIRRALQDCRSLPETPTSTKITKHWQNPPDFWSFLVEKTLQLERISPYPPPRRVLWPKQFLNPMLEGFGIWWACTQSVDFRNSLRLQHLVD